MLLRASGQHDEADYDVVAPKDGNVGGGAHGELLVAFVDATMDIGDRSTADMRGEAGQILGDTALVDIAAVIATFEAIDRIVDPTGTPLHDFKEEATVDLCREIGF